MKRFFTSIAPAVLFALSAITAITSCQSHDEPINQEPTEQPTKKKLRSPEEVAIYIQNLVDKIDGETKSRGSKRRTVANVSAVRSKDMNSRSFTSEYGPIRTISDTLFYIINFNDSAGFAIGGALPESEPVFAIIDDGNLNWKDLENPINQRKYFQTVNFMDLSLVGPGGGYFSENDRIVDEINDWLIYSAKAPILRTRWDQHSPYSDLCSNAITGCVPLAVAQMLSYYQTLQSVPDQNPNSRITIKLNWPYIISECNQNNGKLTRGSVAAKQVAQLCRYIGRCIDAEYKSGKTSSKSKDAIAFMVMNCGLNSTGLKKYDAGLIRSSLEKGVPVFGRGNSSKSSFLFFTSYGGGHAWVYDGYIICRKEGDYDSPKKTMFHCNWGWGGHSNGYYLSKIFDVNCIEIPEDEIQEDMIVSRTTESDEGNGSYYRHNLECALLWKR